RLGRRLQHVRAIARHRVAGRRDDRCPEQGHRPRPGDDSDRQPVAGAERLPATQRRAIAGTVSCILRNTMGKPPTFLEPFESPNRDLEADAAQHAAPAAATKVTYLAIIVALVLLFLLVGIGLHIPSGE